MSLEFSTDLYLNPTISCSELASGWTATVQDGFTSILKDCTNLLLEQRGIKPMPADGEYSTSCLLPIPEMVAPLVDKDFATTGTVQYTTSSYATRHDFKSLDRMYELDQDGAFNMNIATDDDTTSSNSPALEAGIYELSIKPFYVHGDRSLTHHSQRSLGGFYLQNVYTVLPQELVLAFFACVLCSICICMHTKSIFLTVFGLAQIMLALPMAWGVYYFIGGLQSFPVANMNAIFVSFVKWCFQCTMYTENNLHLLLLLLQIVFALGADDIFVVVDHWKNTRSQLSPTAATEDVAIVALPSAA